MTTIVITSWLGGRFIPKEFDGDRMECRRAIEGLNEGDAAATGGGG